MKLNMMKQYIDKKAPNISQTRMNYILYLSDWKSTIDYGKPISNARWFIQDGPTPKEDIEDKHLLNLSDNEIKALDKSIDVSNKRSFELLTRFVYSTFPIITGNKKDVLNLIELASKYNEIKHLI